MGNVAFGKLQGRSESAVVGNEFGGAVDMELVEHRVSRLAELLSLRKDISCFVLGDGGMPLGTYDSLSKMSSIKILNKSSRMPLALFFLRGVVASECGLVKLEDVSALPFVFGKLIEQSMAIIFVLPSDKEGVLVDRVKKRNRDFGFDYGMRMIDNHLIYLVDADNAESETGIAEYFSCGIACDSNLAKIGSS